MREKKRGPFWSVWGVISAVCMALTLMFFTGNESLAAKEGRIRVEMVNVRSEANQNSERVTQLPAGSTFTVTEETVDGNGSTWYHVVFTADGAQQTGWIRSDTAEITAEDVPQEPEGGEEQVPQEGEIQGGDAVIGGITLQEPDSLPEDSDSLTAAQVMIGDRTYSAMSVNPDLTGQAEFYLLYGVDGAGSGSWYYYDAVQGTLQRDVGQFSSEAGALLKALQEENEELKKGHDDALSFRNRIMIGLGAACLILFILVIVLAVKLSQVEYVDEDDSADDDDEEDDDTDDDDDEPIWMGAFRAKRDADRKKRKDEEDEDSEDSFEDMGAEAILAAVMKSKGEPEDLEDLEEEEEPFGKEEERRRGSKKPRAVQGRPGPETTDRTRVSGEEKDIQPGIGGKNGISGERPVRGGEGKAGGALRSAKARPAQPGAGHPAGAGPAQPGTGRPTGAGPAQPGAGRPAGAGPAQPGTGRPAQPGTGRPEGARPAQPGTGRPAGARPAQPGAGRPAGARPTQPGAGRPAGARPAQPGTGRPAGARPTQPGTGRPAGARPTQPGTGRPAGEPGAAGAGPAQPGAGRPGKAPGAVGARSGQETTGRPGGKAGVRPEDAIDKGEEKAEKAAVKAVQAQGQAMSPAKDHGPGEEYEEDYDIEIVDLDDLDL